MNCAAPGPNPNPPDITNVARCAECSHRLPGHLISCRKHTGVFVPDVGEEPRRHAVAHEHPDTMPCTTKCRAHPAWEGVREVFAQARPGEGVARRMDVGKAPVAQGFLRYFARAVIAVSYVSEYGDRKYAQPGKPHYSPAWQDMADGEARSADCEARHLLKPVFQGDYDDESELAHLAHKAWNAMAELEMALKSGRVELRVGNQIADGKPVPATFKRVSL